MTGLPFWSVVWKTLSASSTAGQTSLTSACNRSVPTRGTPATKTSLVSLWKTLMTPGSVTRTAYGSVLVSPTTYRGSSSSSPTVRLNVIAPAHEPGQIRTAMPSIRCGPATEASGSVLYAGPTSSTSSAPAMASAASWPAYRTGANPSSSPLDVIPPALLTATTFSPNSGAANSATSWPCCAKSNADATPPLPAPSTATRIPDPLDVNVHDCRMMSGMDA